MPTFKNQIAQNAADIHRPTEPARDSDLGTGAPREQERRWLMEYADFVSNYNGTIESEGLPLDEWRSF